VRGSVTIKNKIYQVDYSAPIDISIPLKSDAGVTAFGANPYNANPYKSGDFVGALEAGSPVNFYNIKINPHGNGTHTESMLHIDRRGLSINKTLKKFHFLALLHTVTPEDDDNGDKIVRANSLDIPKIKALGVEALILRTLPNERDKCHKQYTGTNPGYIDRELIEALNQTEVKHLLLDLPSVDKERDEGLLSAHHSFWKTKGETAPEKTITELIYVDNEIEDGLFLLNLQIISVDIDASPSKPILYRILKDEIA
jgi:kynurenine formamidase